MLSILITETAINEVGKHHLFNKLQVNLNCKNIEFKILTFKSKESQKKYSFRKLKTEVICLKNYNYIILNLIFIFYKLIRLNPDHLVIGGYGYPHTWIALLYALIFRKKRTLWTGASNDSTLNKNYFFKLLKKVFVKRFNNSIVYGSKSKKYLKELGFKKKIFLTYNISDVEYFLIKKKTIYNRKKIPNFVFCARLVKHKGVEYLIQNFEKLDKSKYHLTIIGDGQLKNFVISKIRSAKINADYLGNISQKKLSQVFQVSDYFISATFNDPFSRTLSEAISSGCYCISSKYDDASHDLITNNTGIIYDPRRNNSLFNILTKILNNKNSYQLKKNFFKKLNFDTDKYSKIYCDAILEALNV